MKANNCECCLMPLAHDPKSSGSPKYCSYCYVDGKLQADGLTLKEFQKRSFDGMKKHGIGSLKAWFFSSMIRFAPYWRDKK